MALKDLICREVEVRFCKDANIFNFRVESMTASEIRARDSALVVLEPDDASIATLETSVEEGRQVQTANKITNCCLDF